ncbi:hypothetical protein AVEN_61209-1 [Araneus ventricosus]|uniref:Uncharacterized protein n=1 Tax=Araneus ventricosus TaxID=182803 RepID=A0A4Y2A752_ARAVE|nr:hypothetical protein AVEN_61209-1 [Araneus ventricosus]
MRDAQSDINRQVISGKMREMRLAVLNTQKAVEYCPRTYRACTEGINCGFGSVTCLREMRRKTAANYFSSTSGGLWSVAQLSAMYFTLHIGSLSFDHS